MRKEPNPHQNHEKANNDGGDPKVPAHLHASHPRVQKTETEKDQNDPPKEIKYIFNKVVLGYRWLRRYWPGTTNSWTAWGTWVAVLAASVYAGIAAYQLGEVRKANVIARQQLEASARPWLSVDSVSISVDNDFIFQKNFIQSSVAIHIKNIGHSPATNVRIFPQLQLEATQTTPSIDAVKSMCDGVGSQTTIEGLGETIFPDREGQPVGYLVGLQRKDVDRYWQDQPNRPDVLQIMGCVAYRSPLSGKPYYTGFIYMVTLPKYPAAPTIIPSQKVILVKILLGDIVQ